MARSTLSSVLLASSDPERLRAWYIAALAPEKDARVNGHLTLGLGGFYVLIDSPDDVTVRNPDPGRMILNFDVDDAPAVAFR
ncbi:MAG: hypothetical protein ABR529_14095 [Actinomycetota bacterium]